ncbi:MAG: hypothetical protein ACK50Q_13590 [Labrys sp. (in: a-proteobacteria)]
MTSVPVAQFADKRQKLMVSMLVSARLVRIKIVLFQYDRGYVCFPLAHHPFFLNNDSTTPGTGCAVVVRRRVVGHADARLTRIAEPGGGTGVPGPAVLSFGRSG